MLTGLTKDVGQSKLMEFFKNLDQRSGTGIPEEIQVIEGINKGTNIGYVTFPTSTAARKFYEVFHYLKDNSYL